MATAMFAFAQDDALGTCGTDVSWKFDGFTLTIYNSAKEVRTQYYKEKPLVSIANYDNKKNKAPWIKKGLNVKKVVVSDRIERIGSCAFMGMSSIQEVEFLSTDVREIGWGAFLDCSRLRNISLPVGLKRIETAAFANCVSIPSITIPDQCKVEDQAFLSCSNIRSISISPTASLGHYVFAHEVNVDNKVRHTLSDAEIFRLPVYVTVANCSNYGLSQASVQKYLGDDGSRKKNIDEITSEVDSLIPQTVYSRNNTYALVFGNQEYRFVPNVPYAIHDARIFAEYCKKTLGIPAENVHLCEDATKQIILEDEFDWLRSLRDRDEKNLIIYYAGHGVPDINDRNKAYLLPTDVRGTKPKNGIALDDMYAMLGDMEFNRVSVFLDACFSGINRDNESVSEGTRGVEIDAEEGTLSSGNVVVFSAAQGNETAQGFNEQGHGLFTYYLLKELQQSEGNISFGKLARNINSNVKRQAMQLKLRKQQNPTAKGTMDNWEGLVF